MSSRFTSARVGTLAETMHELNEFFNRSTWAGRRHHPDICDFTVANPHEMPSQDYVDALRAWAKPLNEDWFAYKMSESDAQRVVANSLRDWCAVPFEPEDIAMTNGGIAALSVGLKALTDPGDEVIYSLPRWFGYDPLVLEAGLKPVKVSFNHETFDLDLDAISRAITLHTRVVIVNTPHNPTGKIYPFETLEQLAVLLDEASGRIGRTIYILSDEPYNRIVFDGKRSLSPTEFYSNTLLAYSYGKALITPGQRMGYLAMPPTMLRRAEVYRSIVTVQIAAGWLFPNALLQHAIVDLEKLSIDIPRLQRKRDRMVGILREIGYQVHVPEGTFYVLPRCPWEDDVAFTEALTRHNIFVMPGTLFEMPGYFRISLTASEDMIERSVGGFTAVFDEDATRASDPHLATA